RCFPHVINIGVQTSMKCLSSSAPNPPPMSDRAEDQDTTVTPIDWTSCRAAVAACRDSSLRREAFRETIEAGNLAKTWPEQWGVHLRVLQLLRDVDTRWSSTYLMVDRAWELAPAIDRMMDSQDALRSRRMDEMDWKVLKDIREFLSIPHSVQQELSFEQTPTLPHVIPAYELLLTMLQDCRTTLPRISAAIDECIRKIQQYMNIERRKPIYALSIGNLNM
ncbi:hypothetical protein FA95DRAFT_1481369, partial [Auriscalpium vulgare]